jgi:hypothetical protein
MSEQEKWVVIDGYENYEVSNLGNVRSLNYRKERRVVMMIPSRRNNNVYVRLTKRKVGTLVPIRKIVAEHFVVNEHGYKYVKFINGDHFDVRASNLIWSEKLIDNK